MIRKMVATRLLAILWMVLPMCSAYAALGGSATQNGITITQNYSSVYYVDTKTSPYPTGFYAVYTVKNNSSSDLSDVWVTIGNFSGSPLYLSLGGNDTGVAHLGTLAAGATKPAYFFLSVDCSSFTSGNCNISAAQRATVDVYLGPPTNNLLASLTTNDITVYDTIAASANKVNSGSVSTTTPSIGSSFTVTVNGSTGTIGGSNIFALSPQTSTSFPANSFELTNTTLTFSNGGTGTYTDTLQIPTSAISTISSADYTVTYTYRVTGTTSSTTSIQPIAYINSGTQIKHTTISSLANIPPIQPASNTLTLTMSVTPTGLGLSGGTATYTVHVTNTGSTAASLDEFIDALASSPDAENYVTGSSTWAGSAIADPSISGSTLIWAGTFTVPANGSADLSFQSTIPATVGTYTDFFYGLVSASQIDTTLSTSDDAEAATSVIVSSQQSTTISISNIPVSATYGGSFTPTYTYVGDGTKSVSSNTASVCTVTNGVVHYVGAGICSLTASATAGATYLATTGAGQTFTVAQATPTVSISNLPASDTYGGSFTPTFSYTGDGTTSVSSNSTSICTVTSGVVHYVGVGTCSLTASATAGTNYSSLTGTAQTFSVGQAKPTISISNLPASGTYGGSFTPTFSYTGDGTMSANSNSTSVCTVTSGVVHYVGIGTCSLTANGTAGTNYTSVTGSSQTFSVGKATPTINISNLPASSTYGGSFTPTFSYTGDGTTSVSSNSTSICTVTGGIVHHVGVGTCSLTASATAGTNYAAVTGTAQTFSVGQATPTISISNLPASGTYGGDFTPTFSYTGDGTTSVGSNSTSICTVTSGVVHYVGVGTCSLTASATAGTNYNSVTGTAQTFSVGKATPTISISNLPASGTYGGDFTPTFSYTGDGTTSISSLTSSVCTVSGGVVRFVGVGTCTLTPSATAGTNYAAVTGASQSFTVGQATATVTLSNLNLTYNGASQGGTATTSPSGLSVSITYNGSTVAPTAAGSYTMVATISDANYSGSASGTLVIAPAAQAINFAALPSRVIDGSGALALTAAGGASGNPVIFSVLSGPSTVNGNQLAITGVGTVVVAANQTGNSNYLAAPQVTQSVVVVGATLNFNLAALNFLNQPVGTTSVAQTLIVSNPNSFPVTISSVHAQGDFSASSACSVLAPGLNCSINVTFTPSTTGARTETLTISNTQSNAPQSVPLSGTGIAASIRVSPAVLGFGSQVISTASTGQTLTIENTGTAPLLISNVATTGDFASSGNCATVPAGSNCSLTVTFTPTAIGSRTGTLTLTDNAGSQSQTVSLTGMGTQASAVLAPGAQAFPATLVGSASQALTATLTNTGSAALTGIAVSVLGDFTETDNCPSSLAAGAKCTLNVVYAPKIAGAESGMLTISDNMGSQTVSLTGTGLAPGASLNNAQLIFGSQLVNTSSRAQTVTFTNTGSAPVTINSVTPTANFADTTNCKDQIAAGASCSVNVTFTPAATGVVTGTVTIVDSAGSQVVTLQGQGVSPGAAITPSFVLFGAQVVNTVSLAQTLTAKNTGTTPLTLSPITVSNNFAESDQCRAVLPVGGSCLISVSFAPTATGKLYGSLQFGDTSGQVSTVVTLGGQGTLPGIATTPSTLFFGSLPVGSASQAQTVTVWNTGSAPLQVGAVKATGDFAETDTCTTNSVAVGENCIISVTMTPTTMGTRTGEIQITDNADGVHLISLSGVGQQAGVSVFPTSLAFGSMPYVSSVQAGQVTGTALSVTLTNSGNVPLQLSGLSTEGDFVEADNCGSTVAVGGICTLTVRFVPTALGHRTGTLTINDNAGGGVQQVSLAGDGSPYGLILTPPVINFGVQTVGTQSRSQTATLTNNTGQALTSPVITPSGEFSETDTCGSSLANGASCTLDITVTPATTGAITGTVTISSGTGISATGGIARTHAAAVRAAATSTSTSTVGVVALSASAIPPGIGISIPRLSFSVTSVGSPSTGQTITLKNTGTALPLTGLSIGETNVAEFPFTTNCPFTLAAQATCTITVNFTPTGYGLRAGIMNITADGGISAALPESGTASKGTPAITLASNVNTTMLQETVTFNSTVTSTSIMPTGAVTFMDGNTVLGTGMLSNGAASLTTAALAAGTHAVTVLYAGDGNYGTGASSAVTQTVLDFLLKPTGSAGASQSVVPGNSATYQVAITPTAGSSFPVTAVLSVSGLPQGATATLNTTPWSQLTATSWQVPATTSLNNVSLMFHVSGQTVAAQTTKDSGDKMPSIAWGLLLLPFAYKLRRTGKKLASHVATLLVVIASVVAITGLSGCGAHNGFFGQAPQSYTVTVTVTAGAVSHSTDLTLNVQ